VNRELWATPEELLLFEFVGLLVAVATLAAGARAALRHRKAYRLRRRDHNALTRYSRSRNGSL
jgi:hypothetical protein